MFCRVLQNICLVDDDNKSKIALIDFSLTKDEGMEDKFEKLQYHHSLDRIPVLPPKVLPTDKTNLSGIMTFILMRLDYQFDTLPGGTKIPLNRYL